STSARWRPARSWGTWTPSWRTSPRRQPRSPREEGGGTVRRAVITGVGVVAPGGGNREEFWQRIVEGKPAIRRISTFDPGAFRSQIAAECDFDPTRYGLTPREIRRTDRFVQLAMAAADEAVRDAGLDLPGDAV